MCLSKVYLEGNEKQLLMGDVATVEIHDEKIVLKSLFGEEKELEANIKEIDFLKNSIILANSKQEV